MKTLPAVAAMAALFAWPVVAQEPVCLPLADALNVLVQQYGESLSVMAQRPDGIYFQIWSSPEGSWTALRTNGELACVVDSGKTINIVESAAKPNL